MRALVFLIFVLAVVGVIMMGFGTVLITSVPLAGTVLTFCGVAAFLLAILVFLISWAVWGDEFLEVFN